jgi:hypothetical protein
MSEVIAFFREKAFHCGYFNHCRNYYRRHIISETKTSYTVEANPRLLDLHNISGILTLLLVATLGTEICKTIYEVNGYAIFLVTFFEGLVFRNLLVRSLANSRGKKFLHTNAIRAVMR